MYTFLYLIIFINIIIINRLLYKTILKPNILFSGVWCISAGIASLGLYNIYTPSNWVQFCSVSLILCFNVMYYLNGIKAPNINNIKIIGSINAKYIYLFNIAAWLFCIKFLIKSLNIIFLGGGFKILRMYAYNSEMKLGTTQELMILHILINAIFVATIIIAVVLITLKKYDFYIISVALVDVLIYTLLFGGRGYLFNMVLYYIFAVIIVKSLKSNLQKVKINKTLISLVVLILCFLTLARSWDNTSFLQTIVQYFAGGFTNLSVILEQSKNNEGYLFGKATFGFIINIILMAVSLFIGSEYSGSDHLITSVTAISRNISPTLQTNATTTLLYPFLRDLGYLGVIGGGIFLALLVSIVEAKFYRESSIRTFCIYIFLLFVLFNSVLTYHLLLPASGFTLLFIYLFVRKNNELEIE